MSLKPAAGLGSWTRREFVQGVGAMGLSLIARQAFGGRAVPVADAEPLRARLKIDLESQLGTIDPNIYGNFTEHLGRCIYGGIFDEGSPLADADGIRRDVLDASRKLRVTQLRWPGGNFVSGYHWQDGIGPRAARPARYNLAWFERESNRFGTDEFIAFCRKLGTEPYLCVNLGSGTQDEAATWVEYCNRPGGTYFSDLRKKYGHPEPYGVKRWGLGNEMYGSWQIGHKDATDYAKAALEVAKLMKWQDPSIKLVACGNGDPSWDRPVLEALVGHVDYISAHHYTTCDELQDYYEVMGSVAQMEATLRTSAMTAEAVSAQARKSPAVATAFDEWGILNNWSDGGKRDDVHKFEVSYNLRDALWVASAYNAIHRHCRTVRLANFAQLVNVIAPIYTTPKGMLLRTLYYPLELYATRAGKIVLDVMTLSPTFETRHFADQPYLDVMATFDEEKRRVTLAVVNRRRDGDVVGTVNLAGARAKPGGRVFVITGPDPEAENTFENPRTVATQESPLDASGSSFEYRFPRHSVSWLEFETEK